MQAGGSGFESLSLHHYGDSMSTEEAVCKDCGGELKSSYEYNRKQCNACSLKESIEMYTNCICPEMSFRRTEHPLVHCLGDECVAFEKTISYAYCKKIDLDYLSFNI